MATLRRAAEARKAGRPSKFNPKTTPQQAYKLALLGCTDPEIADVLGVTRTTLNNWKLEHPAFLDALTRGKTAADADVAHSLYQRACGYSHRAVKHFFDGKTGKVVTATYTEHYPPDTPAAALWLANRQRAKWSKAPQPGDEDDKPLPVKVVFGFKDASVPEPSA
jgi:hypothetical protein